MSKDSDMSDLGCAALIALVGFVVAIVYQKGFEDGKERGYLNACRDYHNGTLKYTLKVCPDNEVKWVKIEEKKEGKEK